MRLKFLTFLLLLAAGALSVKAFYPETVSAETTPDFAQVRIDSTPLDRGDPSRVTSYADVLDSVRPSVVSVMSTRVTRSRGGSPFGPFGDDPFFRRFFGIPEEQQPRERRRQGLGSGVIVSEDGYIITNNHVIEGAEEIRVALADGRDLEAKVVGTDPKTDVAILKIEEDNLPVAVLANSEQIRVGDIVFALGNPLGVGQTVTMGIISATGRQGIRILGAEGYEDFIQTDAAINQGNSGGPLVDAAGRVVGINTAILSRTGGNIGIGFAIPVNLVANVMESLITTGTVERGFLGVNIQDLSSDMAEDFGVKDGRGAIVADILPESPAAGAGLRRGDVIIRIDDRRVENASQLRLTISQKRPGSTIKLTIMRDHEELVKEVVLGSLDQATVAQTELLEGIQVAPVDDEIRRDLELPDEVKGVAVMEVDSASRYAQYLSVGTVIVEINRRQVEDVQTARQSLRRGRNTFLIYHRGSFRFISLTVQQ